VVVVVTTICVPLLAWTSLTLWDLNIQVTRLSEATLQLTERLVETTRASVTRVEFEAHNQRLNQERAGINIRLGKHDDQIRSLEMRRK
jgi:hypothetical protein